MNWKVEKKIIVWENFTWWYGGDKYYAPRNTYFDAYNIDTTLFKAKVTHKNELFVTPETWVPINAIHINENNEVISILNNRNVRRDGTFLHTLPIWTYTRVASMFVSWVKFLYAFQETPVFGTYKIQKLNTNGTYVSEITYTSTGWFPFLSPSNGLVVLEERDRIIFSNYNNLFIIDNTETVQLVHSFPSSENIVGITNFQWQYSIYTNDRWKDSFKYRWSGVWGDAFTLQRQIVLHGYSLLEAINDWPYDYGMMNWELYRFAWPQYQEITAKIGWRLLKNIWGWIYHSWTWREDKWALNRFGAEPWFQEKLHAYKYIHLSNTLNPAKDCIGYSESWEIYFSSYDSVYRVRNAWPAVPLTAHIISNQFVWEDIREEKTLEVVFLKFENTDINNKIKLEVKLNDTGNWIEIYQWYNGEVEQDTYGLRIVADKFTNKLPRFNEIAFRVSFATIDGSKTPEFMGLRAFYNNDIWY